MKSMEVVSHRLVSEFVKNGIGIGFVVKEYVNDELNNNLFLVNIKKIPKRNIDYSAINNYIPSSAVNKFIIILLEGKEN